MSTESHIQIATEGSGPEVRTAAITTYEDGTALTVEQQVVVLADRFGNFIEGDHAWREQMLELARKQVELLSAIAEAVG